MKLLMAMLFTLSSAGVLAQDKPATNTYKVDTEKSKVHWLGKKVTGQHDGHVKVKSGTLTTQGELLTGGEILIDMNSLTVDDLTDKETAGKFVGHMKSPDFFDTAKFPEAKLVIKSSKKVEKGLEVTGDLTMKGKTNPVTFVAVPKTATADTISGISTLNLDRTKWDIRYGSGTFFKGLGDKVINDEFTLTIDVTAKK